MSSIDPVDPIDAQSWWWVPGDEKHSVPGRLVVPTGRAGELLLQGRYTSHRGERGTHDVLWGFLTEAPFGGSRATCVRTLFLDDPGIVHGENDHTGSKSKVKWILLGSHVPEDALHVSAFDVHWEHADEWFGQRVFIDKDWWTGEPVQARRIEPVPVECAVPSLGGALQLIQDIRTRWGHASTTLSCRLLWRVMYDEPRSLGDAHDAVRALRDFVWLAIGGQVRALRVRLKMANDTWVTLLGSQQYATPLRPWTDSAPMMGLPYRAALESRFPQVINRWLELRVDEKEDAFSTWPALILGAVGPIEPALGATVEFLDSVLPKDTKYLERGTYRELVKNIVEAIPENCPPGLAEDLRGRIYGTNQMGLRSRIKDALKSLSVELRSEYQLDDDLVEKAVKARNSMTHSGGRGLSIEDAVMVHGRIRLLALAHVLQRIGIPDAVITKRIKMCRAWEPPISVGLI